MTDTDKEIEAILDSDDFHTALARFDASGLSCDDLNNYAETLWQGDIVQRLHAANLELLVEVSKLRKPLSNPVRKLLH